MKMNEIPDRLSWFRRVLAPPKFDDADKTQTALYLNIFFIASIVLLGASIAISVVQLQNGLPLNQNDILSDLLLIGLLLVIIVLLVIMRRGHVLAASIALLTIVFVGMLFIASGAGATGIFDGAFMALVMLIIMAGLLLGEQAAVVMTVLSIAAAWWLANQSVSQPDTFPKDAPLTYAHDVTIILITLGFLIYMLIRSLRRTLTLSRAGEQSLREQNMELTEMRNSLEQRVTERTAQVQASADIGRAASSILDLEQLAHEMVNLIGDRFNFYYVAIFVVDESGRWAVLREATGEAGQLLKAQGHKLEVGDQSMVGYATGQRKSRLALDVGADAVRFANPLLPYSRSEMVLPLTVGDRVIGALDVQSTKSAAFDESSATSLQGMADQIAVAINNAQQYQREQARAEQTGRLLQATLGLTAQTDRGAMEEQLVQLAVSQFDAAGAQLWSKFDGQLVLTAARSSAPVPDAHLPGQNLIERVFNTGLTVRTDNAADQADSAVDTARQGAIVAPILWQEKVTGVLSITRVQPFSPNDEASIQLLAAQAATTLENIALAEQQRRTLEELNVVNRQLTGEAWQAQTSEQELAYVYHQPGTSTEDQNQRLAEIPIELHGQPIGAISFQDTSDHQALTEDEHAIIRAVVQQMSLVLENQRLAEVAQRAAQRDRALAAAADQIHRPTDLDAVLRVAAEELGRITALSEIGIQLGFTSVEPGGNGDQPPARG